MVSQEEKAKGRIKAMQEYIHENQPLNRDQIESYMLITFGVRPRTTALYLRAVSVQKKIIWKGKGYLATCELVEA